MPVAWDTSKYLALFVSEAGEHLEALGREWVRLERGAPEALDAMFRHAHSVKGMASSMAFGETSRLAHRLEDLLDALRARGGRPHRTQGDLVLAAA
ncbi:MAG: Hpt domain-containing protein, partial [Gemmatimonadales bacterium]|nr:Hpt domain-containing protein [Gemmatimonadales bacterium]